MYDNPMCELKDIFDKLKWAISHNIEVLMVIDSNINSNVIIN